MTDLLARTGAAIFVVLAAWHFYWALGGRVGLHRAIPRVHGRPAFRPRRSLTALIGVALLGCAVLLLQLSCGIGAWPIATGGPRPAWLTALGYGLAAVLLLRALGDGRHVGLLKLKAGPDDFARWDAWVYSPLCLALSVATALVASASAC